MQNYVLENGTPVVEPDIIKWGKWFETADRSLAKDHVDDVQVSTVFLGIDYAFSGGVPVLWETMIFGGEHDGYQERYTSKLLAEEGHRRALALVKDGAVAV